MASKIPVGPNGSPCTDNNLLVAMGCYDGVTAINKFGRNTAVASGVEEEIWDGSAAYSFPATALITSISQTTDQTALRGESVEIQGLDANYALVTQTAVLDGTLSTTVVTLTTPLIRVFRAKIQSSVVADSTVRIHNAGETQDYAVISVGNQQTEMAIYTVPAGKTAYLTNYWGHHNPATGATFTSNPIRLWKKDNVNGYAKQIEHIVGVPEDAGFQHMFAPYIRIGAQFDIFITSQPAGAGADISAGFDLIVVDNDKYDIA